MKTITRILLQHRYLIVLYGIATTFFILQHHMALSWDFSAYVLNAQYWFAQGSYYEPYRPPLMPFIIGILSIGGWRAAEYLYIICLSTALLVISVRFADATKLDRTLVYLFMLSPYTLVFGLFNGTELLSVLLLMLFFVSRVRNSCCHALFLSLATLARYNVVILAPLILAERSAKNIIRNIVVFAIPWAVWSTYNFMTTGNWFTSFADNYALNVLNRSYMHQPLTPLHFLFPAAAAIPFILLGVYSLGRAVKFRTTVQALRTHWVEILLLAVLIVTYLYFAVLPFKDIRYLFCVVLPLAYFAAKGAMWIKKQIPTWYVVLLVAMVSINGVILMSMAARTSMEQPQGSEWYQKPLAVLRDHNIDHCRMYSNVWVYLNYIGKTTEPMTRKELLNKSVADGIYLLFMGDAEPEWSRNWSLLGTLPIRYMDDRMVLLGMNGTCMPERTVDFTYIELLGEHIFESDNYAINTNPCFLLFNRVSTFEKSCNFINFKGFRLDSNRNLA